MGNAVLKLGNCSCSVLFSSLFFFCLFLLIIFRRERKRQCSSFIGCPVNISRNSICTANYMQINIKFLYGQPGKNPWFSIGPIGWSKRSYHKLSCITRIGGSNSNSVLWLFCIIQGALDKFTTLYISTRLQPPLLKLLFLLGIVT